MSAVQHVQELDQSADIFLYHLSNFNPSNPAETIKFASQSGVSFNGPHLAIACSHDSAEISSTGSQHRLQLTLSDTSGTFSTLINQNEGGIEGSKLRIIHTKRKFLDDSPMRSTTEGVIMRSDLVITRLVNWVPGDAIVCECSNPVDLGGGETHAPTRTALRNCSWLYRGQYCNYSGPEMFKLDGSLTLNPQEDVCGKDLKSCRLRNNLINYGGFPTLTRR